MHSIPPPTWDLVCWMGLIRASDSTPFFIHSTRELVGLSSGLPLQALSVRPNPRVITPVLTFSPRMARSREGGFIPSTNPVALPRLLGSARKGCFGQGSRIAALVLGRGAKPHSLGTPWSVESLPRDFGNEFWQPAYVFFGPGNRVEITQMPEPGSASFALGADIILRRRRGPGGR